VETGKPHYRNQLRQADIKVTRIRLALLDLLAEQGRHMTADEITAALRQRAVPADRVTIYRNIDRMIDSGMLVATHLPGRAMKVGLCTQPDAAHHHHIVCERCGRVAETDGCPVLDCREDVMRDILVSSGFRMTGHITQFIGICPECGAAEGGKAAI